MKCPVCDQENPSMLCPRCGFDASRNYEKYPTFGIVRNVPAISALQAERDGGHSAAALEKQQLLDRITDLEHQMSSIMEMNRLLLEKLTISDPRTDIPSPPPASTGTRKPNLLRPDPLSTADNECRALGGSYPVFGAKLRRSQIASVTFLDTLTNAPEDTWDVSADKSGSVQAWAVAVGELYDLYLAADGEIAAPESCKELFAGYHNMRRVRFGNCFNTSNVKNMNGMFHECSSLRVLDLRSFDTSNVQCMSLMFKDCSSLAALNLSSFDTSKVQDMSWMFWNCKSLTSLDLSGFDTSNVQDMDHMFYNCSSLITLDIRSFNTSSVRDMYNMFSKCHSLTALDLGSFDTSRVQDMSQMFWCCRSLTELDLRSFDTSNVQNMHEMFYSCSSLTALDLSNFDTYKVLDMCGMFCYCRTLTTLNIRNFDTSNVTDMGWMFHHCRSLTALDLSTFDTSNVQNMRGMFDSCSSLTALDLMSFDTSKVLDMHEMFYGCSSLTTLKRSDLFVTANARTGMFDGCPAGK